MIWLTSDWHFNHNKEFIYKARGFENVYDMNEAIIEKHNKLVQNGDTVYVLGDLCLGGGSVEALRSAKKMISSLKGDLKIIWGNHDTVNRMAMYDSCWNCKVLGCADVIRYYDYHFMISHYPTITSNTDDGEKPLKKRMLNLYGHTHQTNNFYNDNYNMYHVGVDSHDCEPISIETIIDDITEKSFEKT